MLRRISETFTATHLTAIIIAGIVTPGAVYAVSTTSVSITDPISGHQAAVDAGRRLYTLDPVALYRNNPANQVDITISDTGFSCETPQYTIPSGSAFIITAISGDEYQATTTYNYTGIFVFSGIGCTGNLLTDHFSSVSTTSPQTPLAVEYGVGIPVPAGSTISVQSINDSGMTHIHGYLVPASTVPVSSFHGSVASGAVILAKRSQVH